MRSKTDGRKVEWKWVAELEYAWIVEERKGRTPKSRAAGGVGFLVEEYLRDITEVIEDAKFDKSIWKRAPGERATKGLISGHIYVPPETKGMWRWYKIVGTLSSSEEKVAKSLDRWYPRTKAWRG